MSEEFETIERSEIECQVGVPDAAELTRLREENAELKQRVAEAERKIVDSNLKIGDAFSKGEAAIVEQMKALAAANKRIAELEAELADFQKGAFQFADTCGDVLSAKENRLKEYAEAATAWRELVAIDHAGSVIIEVRLPHHQPGEFEYLVDITPAAIHSMWLRWQESKPKESEAADGE